MAIELISTIVPKNGQSFAIALANDIRGGLHSVETIEERNTIPTDRLAEGMLCYVKGKGMYQYVQDDWNTFTQSSYVVDTYEEMLQLDTTHLPLGTICYVVESGIYYLSKEGWSGFATDNGTGGAGGNVVCYHIGSTPPTDTQLLWIDTTYQELDETFDSVVLDEFRAIFGEMKQAIDTLKIEVATSANTIKNLVSSNDYLKKVVIELEGRIYDLENNINTGGGSGGGDSGDTGDIPVLSILTEDGKPLLCEDGAYLLKDA